MIKSHTANYRNQSIFTCNQVPRQDGLLRSAITEASSGLHFSADQVSSRRVEDDTPKAPCGQTDCGGQRPSVFRGEWKEPHKVNMDGQEKLCLPRNWTSDSFAVDMKSTELDFTLIQVLLVVCVSLWGAERVEYITRSNQEQFWRNYSSFTIAKVLPPQRVGCPGAVVVHKQGGTETQWLSKISTNNRPCLKAFVCILPVFLYYI